MAFALVSFHYKLGTQFEMASYHQAGKFKEHTQLNCVMGSKDFSFFFLFLNEPFTCHHLQLKFSGVLSLFQYDFTQSSTRQCS